MTEDERDLALYQLAQRLTDKHFGPGHYVGLNHFDPSKGERNVICARDRVGIASLTPYGARYWVVLECGCADWRTVEEHNREQLFRGKKVKHRDFVKPGPAADAHAGPVV